MGKTANLRFQLWSKGDDGSFWPVKGQGFTIKVKELPDLAEGVQKALDMALAETKKPRLLDGTDKF